MHILTAMSSRSQRVAGVILLVIGLSLIGCTDFGTDLGFRDNEGVKVTPLRTELVVSNGTSARVHRFVAGQNLIPLIEWFPICYVTNAIEPGRDLHLAYDSIPGYAAGTNVVVYWWHPVPGKYGVPSPDSIRTIVVTTP